jgi:sigma-70-like protein
MQRDTQFFEMTDADGADDPDQLEELEQLEQLEERAAAPGLAIVSALASGGGDSVEVGLPATSRKVRRRGRRTRMRSKTIALKRLTKEELRLGALLYPPVEEPRPRNRSECKDAPRPCPWVSCKHHLYLDVNPETGSIKLNFPDVEVWDMKETCALDVADRNGITLEEVGEIMNLTRERIRQVEVRGLLKLKMLTPIGDDSN